jgi:hypothetical protein
MGGARWWERGTPFPPPPRAAIVEGRIAAHPAVRLLRCCVEHVRRYQKQETDRGERL